MIWRFAWGVAAVAVAASGAGMAQTSGDAPYGAAGSPELPAGTIPPPAPPSAVLIIPGAPEPAPGPFLEPAGPPAFRPALPRETPAEQVAVNPAEPITDFVIALERAYWTNPQLIAERARLRSFDFRLPQARAQYGPQFQYNASYGFQRDAFETLIGTTEIEKGWSSTASAILTQPLFTFGRLRAGEDGARAQIAFARASLRSAEQQTLFSAISAYAGVLRDRAAVGIAADNVNLLAREFGDTGERFRVRESTATDLQQVQSRLELGRAQLLAAQRSAASSDAAFLRFVGGPPGELAQPNPLAIPARTLEDAYAYADAHNPVLASAYARERVSRAQLEAARADLLPRIDLQGRATYGTINPNINDLQQTELRGAVTISGTLDNGLRAARIGEAKAANDADWRLIDAALRENRAELADAWNEWRTQTAAIERLRIAVGAARQAVEGGLLQERAGLRTTIEVLELARDLLQVSASYNAATANAFIAQARVLAAMGALEQQYLLPDAERYDPEAHFRKVDDNGDFPLLTPLVRALDSATTPSRADRPLRDPAAPVAVDGARMTDESAQAN